MPTLIEVSRAYVRDFVAAHLARMRRSNWWDWARSLAGDQPFRSPPLLVDSLELVQIASSFATAVDLTSLGLEDLLLAKPTLSNWADLMGRALAARGRIGFFTSGSQGEPRPYFHRWADLEEEVLTLWPHLQDLVGQPLRRVLRQVPVHHIYGFLWGALLPAAVGLTAEAVGPLPPQAEAGELVVTTPFLVRAWMDSQHAPRPGTLVMVSTAPLEEDLARWLEEKGLIWIELYGSSETAGIGWRIRWGQPFTLFPYWEIVSREGDDIALVRGEGQPLTLPDHCQAEGRTLLPLGRKDRMVQVGGINVSPERVRAVLRSQPGIRDAWVRLDRQTGRLKAWVMIDPDHHPPPNEEILREACANELLPPERPLRFRVESRPPADFLGKVPDWD